jgi:ribosomal protein S11
VGGTSGPQGQAFWANAAGKGGAGQDILQVSDATRAKAQELVDENGYFGVKKTTDRIMEFAKALAGDGASEKQIENLRKGVQAGFDAVAKMYGGFDKLPQVSKDTYDSVMKEFDSWSSGTKLGAGA